MVAVGGIEVIALPIKDPMRATPKAKAPTPSALRAARVAAEKAASRNPKQLATTDGELDVSLPAWAGFRSRASDKPSKGRVRISVGGDGMISGDGEITAEHRAAYRHVLDHSEAMQGVILAAIIAEYPRIRAVFDGSSVAMPAAVDAASLRELVELTSVAIHHAHADGVAYVGYSLACAWDREHALGLMTHRERVVEVGGADTAILGWIATSDQKKRAGAASKAKRQRPRR